MPGGGAFEVAAYQHLLDFARENVSGKTKIGVTAFAEALLVVPRTLAENSGLDVQDSLLKVIEKHQSTKGAYGLDVNTGDAQAVIEASIFDNYIVKRQFLNLAPVLAQQLLLVDEVMRAGRQMGRSAEEE